MKIFKNIEHHIYHVVQLGVMGAGFLLMTNFSYNLNSQFIILFITLVLFTILGFIHHKVNHYFEGKIVIEYILVSLVILAVFLFINIGRI